MFELKSIDQALYNTGLLLPAQGKILTIFINIVLWHHIVHDDDDVEGHQKGERRLVSTEPKLPPIKSPLGKVTPPMHADDDWDYDDDG